jgi:hypothetical protein
MRFAFLRILFARFASCGLDGTAFLSGFTAVGLRGRAAELNSPEKSSFVTHTWQVPRVKWFF